MNTSYEALARFYDELMGDITYEDFADYYEKTFSELGLSVKTVLDLACGTGTMACIMSERGYEVIGTDGSADMLAEAYEKASGCSGITPLLLNQSMEDLDLYGTVDAAYCSLDGLNYVRRDRMAEVLHRVWLFLEPGGVFIFDMNTEYKFRLMDGQLYIDENEDVFCAWRTEYDEEEHACFYGVDIFSREGVNWKREYEEHYEYGYSLPEMREYLEGAGFEDINFYGSLGKNPPGDDEMRIFAVVRKPVH